MSRVKPYKFGVYGGVNKKIAPHALPDDTSPSMQNFILRSTGPELAKGWSKFSSQRLTDGEASPTNSTILRISQFQKSDGSTTLVVFTNHRTYKYNTADGLLVPITPGVNVSTTVDLNSSSGYRLLYVASTTGFSVGDTIIINEGGARQEEAVIDNIVAGDHLVLLSNLTYTHTSVQADAVRRTYGMAVSSDAKPAAMPDAYVAAAYSTVGGFWCAVGTNKIGISGNGTHFTNSTDVTAVAGNWCGISYSPSLNIFVVVSSGGTNRCAYSINGVTWTAVSGLAGGTFRDVAWSPSIPMFVAVGDTASNICAHSPDGMSWFIDAGAVGASGSVDWSPSLALFARVGFTDSGTMYTSTNGTTWTAHSLGTDFLSGRVRWVSAWSKFVGVTSGAATTYYSSDGINWTVNSGGTAGNSGTFNYSSTLGIATYQSQPAGKYMWYTTNGTTWTRGQSMSAFANYMIWTKWFWADTGLSYDGITWYESIPATVVPISHTDQLTAGEQVIINIGGAREEILTVGTLWNFIGFIPTDPLLLPRT